MSTNDPARPHSSRRSFLTAGAAGIAAGGATFGAVALSAEPDPVFALIEAERRAHALFETAIDETDAAEAAFRRTGFDRRPGVQVGTMTTIVGPGGEPLPEDAWIKTPFHLHSVAEVREHYRNDPDRAEIFVARLAEDEVAIARARELSGAEAAEARQDAASAALGAAERALYSATPTTPAGLLAMIAVFTDRDLVNVEAPVDGYLLGLFAAVRSIVGGRA